MLPVMKCLNNIKYDSIVAPRIKSHGSGDSIGAFSCIGYDFFILCDGAGGYGDDVESSRSSVSLIEKSIKENIKSNDIEYVLISSIINNCQNLSIKNIGQSTCIIACIKENEVICASTGDSKAYSFGLDTIEITKYQSKTRMGDFCYPSISKSKLDSGIIIASDGLWNFCNLDKAISIINTRKNVLEELFLESTRTSQLDDFSAILIKPI